MSVSVWPNRDPLEEKGGLNYYGFVNNAATIRFDIDGRAQSPCCQAYLDSLKALDRQTVAATTICCGGFPTICIYDDTAGLNPSFTVVKNSISSCVRKHEEYHMARINCSGARCVTAGKDAFFSPPNSDTEECGAYKEEAACLKTRKGLCGSLGSPSEIAKCEAEFEAAIQKAETDGGKACDKANGKKKLN